MKDFTILNRTYEQWKLCVQECKGKLREKCSEDELGTMINLFQTQERNVVESLERFKHCSTPDTNIVRCVDACTAVLTLVPLCLHLYRCVDACTAVLTLVPLC